MIWPTVRIGDHFDVLHGYAFDGAFFADSGRYIVVTPRNFYEGGGFRDTPLKDKCYTADPPARYVLRTGDLIIAMTEQSEGLLGATATVPTDDRYLHNQRIGLVADLDESRLHKQFLYYLLNTAPVRAQIQATATGTKVRHTAPQRIGNVRVPLPPLEVQVRIAEVLSGYDALLLNTERRMALLEQLVYLLYREWFERLRFPGLEWAARSDSLPDGWTRGTIADVADLERHSVVPDRTPNEEFDHYSFPAFDEGELPSIERGDSIRSMKYRVTAGTVLVPKLNPHIPRVWVPAPGELRRAIASSEYLVLRPRPPITQAFLAAFCGRRDFLSILAGRADGTSTSHRRIKPGDFMAQSCLIPSEDVLVRFDEQVAPILALRQALKLQSQKAREARDYLLPRLMSGQLTV